MTDRDNKPVFHLRDTTPVWVGFLFHLAFSTIGAMLVAAVISFALSATGMKGSDVDDLTFGPSFFLPIVSGMVLGYVLGGSYYSRAVGWVWIVPAVSLGLTLAISFLQPSTRANTLANMFGSTSRCTSICLGQLLFSGPFLSSLAYIGGMKVRSRRGRK